jgi:hypothetical protein
MSSWSRYWVSLWGRQLLFFPPRHLHGCDRQSVSNMHLLLLYTLCITEIMRLSVRQKRFRNVINEAKLNFLSLFCHIQRLANNLLKLSFREQLFLE